MLAFEAVYRSITNKMTSGDACLSLVFVWYNKNEFVYNSPNFPFWHNVQYHAKSYKCYVLHYIEADADNLPWTFPVVKNVHFVDLKKAATQKCIDCLTRIRHLPCRIDYMKVLVMACRNIIDDKLILVLDMDCTVGCVDYDAIARSEHYVEPFFDKRSNDLTNFQTYPLWTFSSYIENYAMLINRHNSTVGLETYLLDTLGDYVDDAFKHDAYKKYVTTVYDVYRNFYGYIFPQTVSELQYENSVEVLFHDGQSYCTGKLPYDYVYDVDKKPKFAKNLCRTLYLLMLKLSPTNQNVKSIDKVIEKLRVLNYDFQSKFNWSNSKQSHTNLAGVLMDKCKNYNFANKQFLLPIKEFV
nr:AcOrf-113 peptide [Calliteara abietis nucleopolyhedrovirus]